MNRQANRARPSAGATTLCLLALLAGACATGSQSADLDTEGAEAEDIDKAESTLDEVPLWLADFGYAAGGWRVEKHPRALADINFDGRADIVGFGDAGVYVALSTGTAFKAPILAVGDFGYVAGGWRVEKHPRLLGDISGDGRPDIVGFGDAGVYTSTSTGTGFSAPVFALADFGYDAGWRVDRHPRMLADVNGDKRLDIVGFGNTGVYVSLSTANGFTAPKLWVASYGYEAGGWRIPQHPRALADVNGDGRADIVGFSDSGVYVSLSTGAAFTPPKLWINAYTSAAGWTPERHLRTLARVNGDGLADIVAFGDTGVFVSQSTGAAFTPQKRWIPDFGYDAGWRVGQHPRTLTDLNADGRADIVGFGDAGVYEAYSTGAAFSGLHLAVANFGPLAGNWRPDRHPRLVADVNGDGKPDIVGFGDAGVYVHLT